MGILKWDKRNVDHIKLVYERSDMFFFFLNLMPCKDDDCISQVECTNEEQKMKK